MSDSLFKPSLQQPDTYTFKQKPFAILMTHWTGILGGLVPSIILAIMNSHRLNEPRQNQYRSFGWGVLLLLVLSWWLTSQPTMEQMLVIHGGWLFIMSRFTAWIYNCFHIFNEERFKKYRFYSFASHNNKTIPPSAWHISLVIVGGLVADGLFLASFVWFH